jgi:uncharacterized protein
MEKNWTHWFEIPVSDLERAKAFYEKIFGTSISIHDFGNLKMGIFPHNEVGAALCEGEWYKPSMDGPLVYMDAGSDLSVVLGRVEEAGGKVLSGKKQISPDHGFMAIFTDTEGNRLALHSMQ